MTAENQIHSGTTEYAPSERETAHSRLAREMAAEGMVLLKNEGLLPLEASARIALFGCGAEKTVKGGIGSGDVNNRQNISIYEGLKEAGVPITSEGWIGDYHRRYEAARDEWKKKVLDDAKKVENPFDAYSANPFVLPEGRMIREEDIKGAEAAVYVISRISGEGKDRRRVEGDYYLSRREKEDILYLNGKKIPTVLILNAGGPVELTDILSEAEYIKAVLHISQPGQQGGHAAADILLGKAVPGGKLTATWAKRYEDYPYAEDYSYLNGNLEAEDYREGLYVGYRYFDSFGIQPLFPFGFGLSYTSFSVKSEELRMTESGIEADVTVKNTGNCYAGREVAQIYVTLPQTGSVKEYHRLAGFAKTAVLQPGEEQRLTITIEQKQFASFSERMSAWYVEEGTYGIWVGTDSASLCLTALLTVSEQTILERTHTVCPQKEKFEELGASAEAGRKAAEWLLEAKKRGVPEFHFVPRGEKKKEHTAPPEAKQPVEELIPLLYGNITQGASTLGSAGIRVPGSAGETTEALEEKYGMRSLIMADGPAGLRLRQSYEVDRQTDTVYGTGVLGSLENGFLEPAQHHEDADTYYQYCTAFPVGTALAQTWDKDLMRKFGEAIAAEMEEFHVDLWLAPGMNIQRNPLCGRNFEYYSEDPLLSGMMAAAVTEGVQSRKGCGVTIKHFACNNQEDNRMVVNARVSERTLREIYFRGFEIAVKQSAPVSIMTSYNLINGVHAANSRDLCTVLAREEWGFDGVIMSDWNTTVPDDGSVPWMCAAAGNDIIMPGSIKDDENIRRAYAQGILSEEDIRSCAGRILAMIRKLDK
ncbi:MAG: glycoside hydrolase family 3 C-terminal domain-containing protein [Eubacteriales bacterium]|nr:glycoside hydrolase family 3 C-terminal domain-containing protein [Eubacteriales bacterium]